MQRRSSSRRPPRRQLVVLCAAVMLQGFSSCHLENDAAPTPVAGAHALFRAEDTSPPAASASIEQDAPRGPRHELSLLSRTELWAAWNSLRGDAYELDRVERLVEDGTHLSCHPEALVRHGGKHLAYHGAVQVDPAFRERLIRFEEVAIEVAREVYGRAPSRLRHFGTYSCRPTRNRTQRLSEHALGNAIDVTGFDFARAKKAEPLPAGLPRDLAGSFQIRVARHWNVGKTPAAAIHTRFLRELAQRLGDRSDVFRGMIGPSRSDHSDHFHFDMSPWRYVYF